jgi:hypothetical protein
MVYPLPGATNPFPNRFEYEQTAHTLYSPLRRPVFLYGLGSARYLESDG